MSDSLPLRLSRLEDAIKRTSYAVSICESSMGISCICDYASSCDFLDLSFSVSCLAYVVP